MLRRLLDLSQPVNRAMYLLAGVVLAPVKFLGDATLIWSATGRFWLPWHYLHSVPDLMEKDLSGAPPWLLPALAVWTLPFLWIGVTLSFRRAMDAGQSPWWSALFFVPYANYVMMLVLAILPTRSAPQAPAAARPEARRKAGSAAVAVGGGVGIALAMMLFSVVTLGRYGAPLFFGTPFTMGAYTAYLYNRRIDASTRETLGVVTLGVVISGAAIFLFAWEGVVCLVMAIPLALPLAWMGALLGRTSARSGGDHLRSASLSLLVLPAMTVIDRSGNHLPLHEVRSSIEIAAPPDAVWGSVIAFPPIAEPRDLIFRLGIAYPRSAHIDGGTRYCVFSTGPFVEPITRWEPGHRLSFDVAQSPPPMRELSLYANVTPRHLDGYLLPVRGEFRLIELPGGRTRLEGSTWYTLRILPDAYWSVFADALIARIHHRVLAHIQRVVEGRGMDGHDPFATARPLGHLPAVGGVRATSDASP